MCGIAGFLASAGDTAAETLETHANAMAQALKHRGPDSQGIWTDPTQGIALTHRRLSIIDLSADGHQPMVSASGRYILSYNGEIYNFQALRARLDYPWQSQSDTEVILAAIEAWGMEKALTAFNGMFAFALWDRDTRQLTLARDRMGEKPLYYGWVGNRFAFASELKAFHCLPGWPPTIDRQALTLLMRYSYIPAPYSIYTGIRKLEPASYITLHTGQTAVQSKTYWSFPDIVTAGLSQRLTCPPEEAITQLDRYLKEAVKLRMIADVPLGAFLSGGIDSSTIVAMMQAHSSRPVKTFSIGFEEAGFDEAPYAKAVANHLGTEHTEIYVSSDQAKEVIPHLPHFYDEPFADSSQIPTYLVSRFAREHVTVTLSGDGGDELFGGYNRYVRGPALWRILSAIPLEMRHLLAKALLHGHRSVISKIAPDDRSSLGRMSRKLSNYYEKITIPSREAFYRTLCSICDAPEKLVLGASEPVPDNILPSLDYAEWMMMQDALTYFPGDILTKVDRAAMAVSLETRIPFTDPDVMAFAWRLPRDMRIRDGKGKWLLRQLLYRYVPETLIERPKAGFAVPIGSWLRGPLQTWAEDLLSADTLTRQGYFDPAAVREMWQQHQSGQRAMEHQLWNILMFQSWLATTTRT